MSVSEVDLTPPRRPYSNAEVKLDAMVHVFGLAFAIAASVSLIDAASAHDPQRLSAVCIYAFSMTAMFLASAAYNVGFGSRFRPLFRRCDHSAIFLLIAGTYTPFTLHLHTGFASFLLTAAIWLAAGAGIFMKFRAPLLFEKFSDAIYLALGWASIPVILPLASVMPTLSLALITTGGVLYSVGVVFHRWERLIFHNAIWHAFVLLACICHYQSILTGVVLNPVG